MNLPADLQIELLNLIAEMCEGTATDAVRDRIHVLTSENREARLFYLQHMHLAAKLRWSFDGARVKEDASHSSLPPTGERIVERDELSGRVTLTTGTENLPNSAKAATVYRVPRLIGVVAAMLVVGYFASLAAMLGWDTYVRSRRYSELAEAKTKMRLATLVESRNCHWEDRGRRLRNGATLTDQPLRLVRGVAEIRFADGATVLLEGPAEFQPVSTSKGYLSHGRLLARVTRSAVGFTIATASAEIIDLGTEFGVEVDEDQRTEVHVVTGKVRLLPKPGGKVPEQRTGSGEIVVAGEARQIYGTAKATTNEATTEVLPFDKGRFVRFAQGRGAKQPRPAIASNRSATLLLHYDVNNLGSWNAVSLSDLNCLGGPLTPASGRPRFEPEIIEGGVNPTDFAAPVYMPNGAQIATQPPPGFQKRDRAFLDFKKLGVLTGPAANRDQAHFSAGDAETIQITGYTLEGMYLIRSSCFAVETTGIGFCQSTIGENQLLRVPRGQKSQIHSSSAVDNAAGSEQDIESVDVNIDAIIPRDEWFHFVKVHDPSNQQIRFYVNGVLQKGFIESLDPNRSAVEYHAIGLNYGDVGTIGREIRDIGYSMTRIYRGALSDAEILANFREVAFEKDKPGSTRASVPTLSNEQTSSEPQ